MTLEQITLHVLALILQGGGAVFFVWLGQEWALGHDADRDDMIALGCFGAFSLALAFCIQVTT